MPLQELLTESQRLSLQTPAGDERGMVRHYTLTPEDLTLINRRRGDPNRLGFAVMLLLLALPRTDTPSGASNRLLSFVLSSANNSGLMPLSIFLFRRASPAT